MAKKVYKINKNKIKMNNKSELNSKADSVVLTGFRKIEEDAFLDEVKENAVEGVSKLNAKSELNSKADSVVLTGFRKIEEDAFLDEVKETQDIKNSKGWLALIIESLSKKFEKFREKNRMVKELKDLEKILEKIKNEQKDLLEHYTRLVKIQELEKQELEKKMREYNSLAKISNFDNLISSMVKYDTENSLKQNEDSLHLIVESLNTKFEKVREKNRMVKELEDLEQTFDKIKNEQKDLLERCTKLIKIQKLEKEELRKSSDKYLFLVKELKEKYDIDSGFNNQPSFIKNFSTQHKNNPYMIAYDCFIESEKELEE